MQRRDLIHLALFLGFALTGATDAHARAAKLRVVTTIPDLADIVKEIGGDRVDVTSIARGRENTHAVAIRPSHMIAMSKADLFVQIGLALESSYVPGLLENCHNSKIQPGQPGFVNASEGWTPIDVPASVSRQQGDVHPFGNPHMNMDPRGGRQIAERVLAGLEAVDPAGEKEYGDRYTRYVAKLEEAERRWAEGAEGWAGRKVVIYHQEYNYLADAYGIEIVGAIEPKIGIPPTPNHVAELIERMKAEHARVILTAIWSNNATVARIAEATGARVVELPNMCGGLPGTDEWIAMMDTVHERLAAAFASTPEAR